MVVAEVFRNVVACQLCHNVGDVPKGAQVLQPLMSTTWWRKVDTAFGRSAKEICFNMKICVYKKNGVSCSLVIRLSKCRQVCLFKEERLKRHCVKESHCEGE